MSPRGNRENILLEVQQRQLQAEEPPLEGDRREAHAIAFP